MFRSSSLWLCAALLFVACDDNSAGRKGTGPNEPRRPQSDQFVPVDPPDSGPVDADLTPDTAPPEPDAEVLPKHRLEIVGQREITLFFTQQTELVVRYLDEFGRPVRGEVKTRLLDEQGNDRTGAGVEGTSLADTLQQSAEDGTATFRLVAGQVDVQVEVEASAEYAEPVSWRLRVTRDPVGALSVRVRYSEVGQRYLIADALPDAQVVMTRMPCEAALSAPANAIEIIGRQHDIAPFSGDDTVRVDNLQDGRAVNALGFGFGPTGRVLAAGCTEIPAVVGGETTAVTVDLIDLGMEYKGTYHVNHVISMLHLFDNDDDPTLRRVGEVLQILGAIGGGLGRGPWPRGDGIVTLICDRGNVDPAMCEVLRVIGAPLIEEVINAIAPPEVLVALDAVGDIVRILHEMRIVGEMVIAQTTPDETGLLLGNESRWQGLEFAWRMGCPFDDPEECIREFSLIEVGVGARGITAPFDAEVQSEDMLYIYPHTMNLNLGRVALSLIERWVLPAVLNVEGPVTLEEFVATLISCPDINAGLPPNDPQSGVCEQFIVEPLVQLLRQSIEDLGFGVNLFTFEGSVRVADEAIPDLLVDRLYDGVWHAAFGDRADLIPDVGSFAGCRRGQCEWELLPMPEEEDAPNP